jgi:hypothetical protein
MTKDTFDERELMAEIESQLSAPKYKFAGKPGPAQSYYILNARAKGIDWSDIMKYCKERDWPGSETTLRRWIKAQGENQGA